jgi:hypothetical protein
MEKKQFKNLTKWKIISFMPKSFSYYDIVDDV